MKQEINIVALNAVLVAMFGAEAAVKVREAYSVAEAAIELAHDMGSDEGYEAGEAAGYSVGYADGHNDGLDDAIGTAGGEQDDTICLPGPSAYLSCEDFRGETFKGRVNVAPRPSDYEGQ